MCDYNISDDDIDTTGSEFVDNNIDSDSSGEEVNFDVDCTDEVTMCDEVTMRDEEKTDSEPRSMLKFILTVFFRIIVHFNIPNNAASKILAFISFVLGMLTFMQFRQYLE